MTFTLLVLALAATPSRPVIGMTDFDAQGVRPDFAQAVSGKVAHSIERLGLFELTTADTTRALLGVERQKLLLGCESNCGQIDLASLTTYDVLLMGKVARLAGKKGESATTLELILLNVKTGKRMASGVYNAASEADLFAAVDRQTVKVLAPMLAGKEGQLKIAASEAGANVSVDDVLVGTTPLDGVLTLPGGPHFLSVEKDGFVAFRKEVRIVPESVVEERPLLVPSPDTVAAYESRNGKMRAAAWIATGLAVVGLGSAGYFQWRAVDRYGATDRPGTFLHARAALLSGEETDVAPSQKLRAEIQTFQQWSLIGAGAGAAAGLGAAYFWIAGDPPDRYRDFGAIDVIPSPSGASLSLSGQF